MKNGILFEFSNSKIDIYNLTYLIKEWIMIEVSGILLGCPFCGAKPRVEQLGTNKVTMIITCTVCGCSLETNEAELNKDIWWNTRYIKPTNSIEDK